MIEANLQAMNPSEFLQLYLGVITIAAGAAAIGVTVWLAINILVEKIEARRTYAQYYKPILKQKSKGTAGPNGERAR